MEAFSFLETVAGAARLGQATSADRPVRLAVVDPAYDPFASPYPNGATASARVTFEGESTLSGKAYPVAAGFVPRAGQRVYLIPQGNGYIVAGAVSVQVTQGFWTKPDGTGYGVEFGGGNRWDSAGGLTLSTSATIGGRKAATAPGAGKIHWQDYTPTTDSTGVATITHGAGFTPTFVMVGQWGLASGTNPVHVFFVSGSADATTFRVRVFNAAGTALASSSVGISAVMGG